MMKGAAAVSIRRRPPLYSPRVLTHGEISGTTREDRSPGGPIVERCSSKPRPTKQTMTLSCLTSCAAQDVDSVARVVFAHQPFRLGCDLLVAALFQCLARKAARAKR